MRCMHCGDLALASHLSRVRARPGKQLISPSPSQSKQLALQLLHSRSARLQILRCLVNPHAPCCFTSKPFTGEYLSPPLSTGMARTSAYQI